MTAEQTHPVILTRDHETELNRFLMTRAESSLMLLSNARLAGIEDRGGIFQGTYAAYRQGNEICGVAVHFWNGMVIIQAPENPSGLVRAAITASGRHCTGIVGPYDQVRQVLPEFREKNLRPAMNGRETLFSLDVSALVVPDLLQRGEVTCRQPSDDEIPLLVDWRIAFMREHLGSSSAISREQEARDLVRSHQKTNNHWVLDSGGTLVATTAVSAGIVGMVQLRGVYTLPLYRNRGYGRAVVAGSLLTLEARGIKKAVLFTGTDMPAAQKMYRALGFRPVGEFGLVLF